MSSSVQSSFFAISMWHSCLGHPSLLIFRKFLNVLDISFLEEHLCSFSCNSYNINKSHKLPITKSSITSSSSLDIIFSDVWTSPFHLLFLLIITQSISGFIRSVENRAFIQPLSPSRNLLKTISPSPLKALYIDNGGKFLALRSFLATHGITHLTTPPHTPEHNGYSKCRNLHIVETGLTLLHQASIPLTFWPYAFATAVYLLN